MSNSIGRQRRLPPDTVGPMLLAARQRLSLSQSALGRMVHLTPGYVAKLEHGTRCPSVTVADRLAEALRLTNGERDQLLTAAVNDAGKDHPWRRMHNQAGQSYFLQSVDTDRLAVVRTNLSVER